MVTRRYWMAGTGLGPHRVAPTLLFDPRRFRPYAKAVLPGEAEPPSPSTFSVISIDDATPVNASLGSLLAAVQALEPEEVVLQPRMDIASSIVGRVPSCSASGQHRVGSSESVLVVSAVSMCGRGGECRSLAADQDRPSSHDVTIPVGGGGVLKRARTWENAPRLPPNPDPSDTERTSKTLSLTQDRLYLSPKVTGSESSPLYLLEAGADLPTALTTTACHWDLSFSQLLGRGRLGSAYRATLTPIDAEPGSVPDSLSISLIAKLMVLAPEAHLHNGKPRSDAYPDARRALDAAWDEAEIYGRLAPIQGECVPYYYGLVSTKEDDHTHLIALMSDAGEALEDEEDSSSLYRHLGDRIKQVYRRLHREFLVLHIDIGARHVRICRDGPIEKVFLIDFEASMARTGNEKEVDERDWELAVENEMREVEALLMEGMAKKTN